MDRFFIVCLLLFPAIHFANRYHISLPFLRHLRTCRCLKKTTWLSWAGAQPPLPWSRILHTSAGKRKECTIARLRLGLRWCTSIEYPSACSSSEKRRWVLEQVRARSVTSARGILRAVHSCPLCILRERPSSGLLSMGWFESEISCRAEWNFQSFCHHSDCVYISLQAGYKRMHAREVEKEVTFMSSGSQSRMDETGIDGDSITINNIMFLSQRGTSLLTRDTACIT